MTATAFVNGTMSQPTRLQRRRPTQQVRRLRALMLLGALVLVLVLAARLIAATLGGVPASASEGSLVPRVYVVHQGDTLWSIARQLQPNGDPRPLVDRLERAAPHRVLHPGDVIPLPAS